MRALIEQCEGRLNRLERVTRGGTVWWRKERSAGSAWLIPVANAFFRVSGNPVRVLRQRAWQEWELASFEMLHGSEYEARMEGAAVLAMELPGTSLSQRLDAGTLTTEMLNAAGAELRRAHEKATPEFPSGWSHGDPHLGNFVFHAPERRARLMDFEVQHHLSLGAAERQADDLRVFLQDLVGRIGAEQWRPFALEFLAGYGRPEIIALLRDRLRLPSLTRPFARIWWAVRTTYMPARELRRRLAALREAL